MDVRYYDLKHLLVLYMSQNKEGIMATITATLANTHGSSSRGRQPYYVQQIVDLTANSINPNGDVVQVLTVPANTKIIARL